MTNWILVVDFGSQVTQLIARRIREQNIYCELIPYNQLTINLLYNEIDVSFFIILIDFCNIIFPSSNFFHKWFSQSQL